MNTDTNKLLEQCACPMLLVENGIVTQLNHAAAARQFLVGVKISDLICQGKEEYSQLTDGKLCLTLQAEGIVYPASVVKTEQCDIFRLDSEYDDPALRAFALAAKQLRQPLANALICAQELSSSGEEQQQLNRSLYQLHRAICNMSDVAKYSAQRSSRMESRDIVSQFMQTAEKASAMLTSAGITLHYNAPKKAVIGLVDAEKLERALLNLLSNAAKFAPEGKSVKAELSQKGNKLYISVTGEGTQIPQQLQGDLFSRYLREPELEDGRWGIGLGLTLVRNAAMAHNGTLLMENTPAGQKFTMSLSLTQSADDIVRSPVMLPVDYTGGYDRVLVELSDVLPADLY